MLVELVKRLFWGKEKPELPIEWKGGDSEQVWKESNKYSNNLKNYKKTISEAIRVTKNEGYIIFGIPNLAHLINRIYLLFGFQPMCIHLDSSHVRSFTHKNFVKLLNSLESVKLIDCRGALMYPFPLYIAKLISDYFVGLSGYVCYLLHKLQ